MKRSSLRIFVGGVVVGLSVLGGYGQGEAMIDPDSKVIQFFPDPLPKILCRRPGEEIQIDYSKIFHAHIQVLEKPVRAPEANRSGYTRKVRVRIVSMWKGTLPAIEGKEISPEGFDLYFGTDDPEKPLFIPGCCNYPRSDNGKPFYYIFAQEWEGRVQVKAILNLRTFRQTQLQSCVQKPEKEERGFWGWMKKWWSE